MAHRHILILVALHAAACRAAPAARPSGVGCDYRCQNVFGSRPPVPLSIATRLSCAGIALAGVVLTLAAGRPGSGQRAGGTAGCSPKKRMNSALASGPRGSV